MMKYIYCFSGFLFVLTLVIYFPLQCVHAETKKYISDDTSNYILNKKHEDSIDKTNKKKSINIGGREYSSYEVISDFEKIAYSSLYLGEWNDSNPSLRYIKSPDEKAAFYNEINIGKDKQAYRSLSKWNRPVRISVQWPPFQVDERVNKDDMVEAIIIDQAKRLIPVLSDATKLNISYLIQDDETVTDYANVRIVYRPFLCDDLKRTVNWFKIQGGCPGPRYSGGYHGPENKGVYYSGFNTFLMSLPKEYRESIVPFTFLEPTQVEGMLFSDAQQLNLAVCIIWQDHSEDMIRALVTECLVRALGLPGLSRLDHQAVLGDWNKVYKPYTWNVLLDRKHSAFGMQSHFRLRLNQFFLWKAETEPDDWNEDKEREAIKAFLASIAVDDGLVTMPTAYDLFMLRLLYDKSLHTDMDRLYLQPRLLRIIEKYQNLERK